MMLNRGALKLALLAICLSVVTCELTLAQSSYYGYCENVSFGCYTCYDGLYDNWYNIYEENGVYYYLNSTSSVVCSNFSGGIPIPMDNYCDFSVYCSITYQESYRFDSLSVSTSSPSLRMTTAAEDDYYIGEISSSSVSIYGPRLLELFFTDNTGERLHFIKKISTTQYATNFGVYEIGTQTSVDSFTFTYKSYQSSKPPTIPPFDPPTIPTSGVGAFLYPYPGMEVTDSSKSFIFSAGDYGVVLFGKNAETDFKGITLYNPIFGIRNLAFYPPYDDPDDGTIVFQTAEGSDYRAVPCEYDQSGSFEAYDFEVDLSDLLSVLESGSFFSLSLDAIESRAKPSSADSMAFNLF